MAFKYEWRPTLSRIIQVMKQVILSILFIILSLCCFAQLRPRPDSTYNLKIEKIHDHPDSVNGTCLSASNELYFSTNCLSSFKVKGKRYLYHRVVSMTADSLMISLPGENDPVTRISPADIDSLVTLVWCYIDGKPGFQHAVLESGYYKFSLVRSDQNNIIPVMRICWDAKCKKTYLGFLYCDDKLGCKYIFKKGRSYYLYGKDDAKNVKFDVTK
jgi:hypothetical protein